jgi:hypothetical protein
MAARGKRNQPPKPPVRKRVPDAELQRRKRRLVKRLRKVAAEEEALGLNEIAADFRQRADDIESGRTRMGIAGKVRKP